MKRLINTIRTLVFASPVDTVFTFEAKQFPNDLNKIWDNNTIMLSVNGDKAKGYVGKVRVTTNDHDGTALKEVETILKNKNFFNITKKQGNKVVPF